MNVAKRLAALGAAVLMVSGLAACSTGEDTKWVAKYGETTVPAGVYIDKLISSYTTIVSQLDAEVKDPLKEQIDGVSVSQKITEDAQQQLHEYIAIERKFAEMGLTVSDADTAAIEQNVDQFWAYVGETYQANGVSRESYVLSYLNGAKRSQIFQAIYGEGGTDAVPEQELKDKFYNDYAKILVIPATYNNSASSSSSESSGDAQAKADEAKQKASDLIDKYLEQAKAATTLEEMENVVYEAKKEITGNESLEKPASGESFTIFSRDSSPYTDEMTDAVFNASYGVPTKVETDTTIYLFVRYDISENEADFTAYRTSLVSALRSDAFSDQVAQWADSLSDVTYNDAALKRYTPEKIKI